MSAPPEVTLKNLSGRYIMVRVFVSPDIMITMAVLMMPDRVTEQDIER